MHAITKEMVWCWIWIWADPPICPLSTITVERCYQSWYEGAYIVPQTWCRRSLNPWFLNMVQQMKFKYLSAERWQFQKCLIFTMNCCSKCTILRQDSTTKPLSPWWFGTQLEHMSSKIHIDLHSCNCHADFYLATFIMHLACTMCCALPTFGKNEIVESPYQDD